MKTIYVPITYDLCQLASYHNSKLSVNTKLFSKRMEEPHKIMYYIVESVQCTDETTN